MTPSRRRQVSFGDGLIREEVDDFRVIVGFVLVDVDDEAVGRGCGGDGAAQIAGMKRP